MRDLAAPSVKQRLAAVRHLFDWLVTGQAVPVNPAASVRGPRHVVTSGQTPVLDPSEARALLEHQARNSSAARVYARRVCGLRMLAAKNSRKRMPARSPAAATSAGNLDERSGMSSFTR
jgi:site-specific recombinase XerC